MPKAPWYYLLLYVPAAARVGLAQEKQGRFQRGMIESIEETPDLQQKPIGSRALDSPMRGWRFWMSRWIPANIMRSFLSTAPTLFTESMSAPVCLMNTRVLRTFMRESTNFGESQIRNRATWPSGGDMPGL